MENNSNRDKLLDEILRETAHKSANSAESSAPKKVAVKPKAPASSEPREMPSESKKTAESVFHVEDAAPPDDSNGFAEMPETFSRLNSLDQSDSYDQSDGMAYRASGSPDSFHNTQMLYADLEGDSQYSSDFEEESTMSARPRKRRKKHRVISSLIMAIIIVVVSVVLSGVLIVYGQDMLGINSDSSTKIVTIPNGATMDEIAEILEEEGIISQPQFFLLIAGMSDMDTDIKPGDHELRPDMAYETILSELVSEPLDGAVSVSITFPEGIRLVDAADLLEENNVCDADEFMDYFNNDATFGFAYESYLPSFQDDKFYAMEGYLFPDTYTFYQEMSVELVCQKILDNFNSKITSDYYDRMEALGLSLDQTITLASIIQKEAGSVDDMPTISSVFWNRLNNPSEYPLLQSDVTYFYVEEVIKPHSDTYDQDLYDSYDTYTCTGLPAGPICNPGADAIYAALYPDNTNYYYFYADTETGVTYFSRTLDEHNEYQEMVAEMHAEEDEEDSDDDTAE